ncbi:hypothetical protein BKA56DRAFT_584477 [Ilyonectria sp. MPI-CAGE-AT-0026]|nr:hypothetical protein BKA56DRAFT_584477 [Ilyonectria sp. MPI-CAGE-AT-0026]
MDGPTSPMSRSKMALAPANTHYLGDSTSDHTRTFRDNKNSGHKFKPLTTVPTIPELPLTTLPILPALPLRTSDPFEPQSFARYYDQRPVNRRKGIPPRIMTSSKKPYVPDRRMLERLEWARQQRRILAQRRDDTTQLGDLDARSPQYEAPRSPIAKVQEKTWSDQLREDVFFAARAGAIVVTFFLTILCGLGLFGAFLQYGIGVRQDR